MKKHFFIILLLTSIFCSAQTLPLRTYTEIPENAYLKDTNNELQNYEGTWKGIWDGKTIFVTFKKLTNQYNANLKYYKDYIVGKFKVLDGNGNILFDNLSISDANAKIWGARITKIDNKYALIYNDADLCNTRAKIEIDFTDATKPHLNWNLYYGSNMITTACPYYNTGIPEALPEVITLTKQ